MKTNIYCTNPKKGQLYFYLYHDGTRYYLFQLPFRKSVCAFFGHGVYLDDVFNYSRAKRNPQIVKTISKLPYSIDDFSTLLTLDFNKKVPWDLSHSTSEAII